MSAALYETLIQLPDLPGAACQEHDPELWDDTPPDMSRKAREAQARQAKQICNLCPQRDNCLEYALSARLRAGIWGAMTTDERDDLIHNGSPKTVVRHCTRRGHPLQYGSDICITCDDAAAKRRDRDRRYREKQRKQKPRKPRGGRCAQCRITKHRCTHPVDGAV
jgi:WhiB family redox-sensing transcriptional regulator